MNELKKKVRAGLLDPDKVRCMASRRWPLLGTVPLLLVPPFTPQPPFPQDDPFDLFISATDIRYCYYSETQKILGSTYGMLVLQDFEVTDPSIHIHPSAASL